MISITVLSKEEIHCIKEKINLLQFAASQIADLLVFFICVLRVFNQDLNLALRRVLKPVHALCQNLHMKNETHLPFKDVYYALLRVAFNRVQCVV